MFCFNFINKTSNFKIVQLKKITLFKNIISFNNNNKTNISKTKFNIFNEAFIIKLFQYIV